MAYSSFLNREISFVCVPCAPLFTFVQLLVTKRSYTEDIYIYGDIDESAIDSIVIVLYIFEYVFAVLIIAPYLFFPLKPQREQGNIKTLSKMKVIDLLAYDGSQSVHELPSDASIRLSEVSKLIFKAKKTTVLTGAGISCNAGIPDFRSNDGLYNLVKQKYPKTVVKGQDLFDISLFRDELTLEIFCTFMEKLYASSVEATPTETHKFIKLLKDKKKLLRCYTQNIDDLESKIDLNTGVKLNEFDLNHFNKFWKPLDVIQLHGNLNELSCTQCFSNFSWDKHYQSLLSNGENPECMNCYKKYQDRLYQGKRLTGSIGILRPNIVLYGENHPQSDILSQGLTSDLRLNPDLLLIMGTSLKVDGVKKLVRNLSSIIHQRNGKVIFINKTPVSGSWEKFIDYQILSDCDGFIKFLKQEIPDLFLTQEQLDSKKLKQLESKGLKQLEKRLKEKIKQEQEHPIIKQEIKQEPSDQGECTTQETSPVKVETNTKRLTPPNTPRKRKQPASNKTSNSNSNRPILKRRNMNVDKKVKYDLPSPPSSFSDNTGVIVKQESIQ